MLAKKPSLKSIRLAQYVHYVETKVLQSTKVRKPVQIIHYKHSETHHHQQPSHWTNLYWKQPLSLLLTVKLHTLWCLINWSVCIMGEKQESSKCYWIRKQIEPFHSQPLGMLVLFGKEWDQFNSVNAPKTFFLESWNHVELFFPEYYEAPTFCNNEHIPCILNGVKSHKLIQSSRVISACLQVNTVFSPICNFVNKFNTPACSLRTKTNVSQLTPLISKLELF